MTVFLSFIRKEFIHILRDWRSTLIVLVTPVVLVLIFGFAISTEIRELKLMTIVPHHTEATRQLIERLANTPTFTYLGETDHEHLDAVLRSGKVNAVLVFAPDGDRMQLVVDASDANISQASTAYIMQALSENNVKQPVVTVLRHNPQMKSSYNYVPGIMGLIFILICAIMTSVSIVREKETGTMEVLLVSPIRPQIIIVAKLIPYMVISFIDLATILLLVHYVMDVPLISLGGIIAISMIYIVLALALGLVVSTVTKKQIVALLICAMLMILPMMMFSGMLFPVENMPPVLDLIPYIIPARWYIDAIRKLMVEGVPFVMVIKETAILVGMTVFLLVVALKKFNDRL